jgi:hypothetical protein
LLLPIEASHSLCRMARRLSALAKAVSGRGEDSVGDGPGVVRDLALDLREPLAALLEPGRAASAQSLILLTTCRAHRIIKWKLRRENQPTSPDPVL